MNKILFLILLPLIIASCSENIEKKNFNYFLNEPCMIVNYEGDNTIEGEYILVKEIQSLDSTIKIDLPADFYLNGSNCKNWIIGWGTNKPLYDAGVENLRVIEKIDTKNNTIYFGKLLRGEGLPKESQRIVFWNTKPSRFNNVIKKPIIDPAIWPQFNGKSISFAGVEYDSLLNKWIMLVNECDTNQVQVYAAMSDDLKDWQAANDGAPILKSSDFKNCNWALDKTGNQIQTPNVTDIIRQNNKWYIFLDGYNANGKRNIGVAISDFTLLGSYKIIENPLLSVGEKGTWNDEAVFYGKVKKYKNEFILFYDGRNSDGYERVGMAQSKDLIKWDNSKDNPVIDQHTGWSSDIGCSEPDFIEIHNDSVFLMISGVKKFKMGAWNHYISKRMYLDKSGNVNDTQSGIYLSTDGGKTFSAHKNNPVFTNDYSNKYENEHLGGNFKLIKTDSADYIFYQAKSSFEGSKYNIMLRVKEK